MAEHPGKRSDPAKLRLQKVKIIEDMESRLPVDTEDPESVTDRRKRLSKPRRRGATVLGFRTPANTA